MGGRTKPYHNGSNYRRRARAVRMAAYLNPETKCRRCGLTLAQRRVTHPHDTWDAGHLIDGEVGGILVPEHASCNRSAGIKARMTKYSGYDW